MTDKVLRALWVAIATLTLYNEANNAGLIDKAKPYFAKIRDKLKERRLSGNEKKYNFSSSH